MKKLPKKNIPGTELDVSVLGLGTVKLGRDKGVKYPESFTIPNDEAALALLQQAWDLGINLIDTAPAYGNSEQRLGELLPHMTGLSAPKPVNNLMLILANHILIFPVMRLSAALNKACNALIEK